MMKFHLVKCLALSALLMFPDAGTAEEPKAANPASGDKTMENGKAGEQQELTPREQKVVALIEASMNGVEEPEKALEILEKLGKEKPETLVISMGTRIGLLLDLEKYAEANKLAAEFLTVAKDDARMLNEIAWALVNTREVGMQGLFTALKMTEQATKVTGGKDGSVLDTMARVHFEIGRAKAIVIQSKAIEVTLASKDKDAQATAEQLKAVLAVYDSVDPHGLNQEEDPGAEEEGGTEPPEEK